MELQDIEAILDFLKDTQITEIEIQEGSEAVRITRSAYTIERRIQPPQIDKTPTDSADILKKAKLIRSHLVGTVYLSPTPGAKPYIEVGQIIRVDDLICHIEAMKMPTKIKADKAGKITAILVENGAPIEYNQPLIMLE